MRKLDLDRDGQITEHELFRVLSSSETSQKLSLQSSFKIVEAALKKIALGADDLNNMRDYSK
jgi:Ca2+-binding EF-hand superfamily protein